MKKLTAVVLLMVALIVFFSIGFADANWGTKSLSDAEIAAKSLSLFLGEGKLVSISKMVEYDEINSRYVLIGDKDLGGDLIVMVRISDSLVYYWSLDLSVENLIKARLVFDERAPFCYIAAKMNDDEVKTAFYTEKYSFLSSFDKFKNDAETIIQSLSYGGINAEKSVSDPILSLFPGIEWGMTRDKMIEEYGEDCFSDIANNDIGLLSIQDILGERSYLTFLFQNGGLNSITLLVPGDEMRSKLIDTYNGLYGESIKVMFTDTFFGNYEYNPDGDSYCWRNGNTCIIVSDRMGINYKPLY